MLVIRLQLLAHRRPAATCQLPRHWHPTANHLNSATRLLVITLIALAVAFAFRPFGFGVLFGLALFQVVLVLSTVIPVWMKIRKGELDAPVDSETQKS